MFLAVARRSKHIIVQSHFGLVLSVAQINLLTGSALEDQVPSNMDTIPEGFKAYKRTPLFTSENVPKTLLHRHNTKGGSWGKIHVSRGSLEYLIFGPPERVYTLTPGTPGIIKAMEYHKVTLLEPDTEFHVEFYAENPEEAQAPRHVSTEDVSEP